VWCASLDLDVPTFEDLARHLSDEEWERAGRFHFRYDAIRFAVSRAVLRVGLAECLGVEPSQVVFRRGRYGRPELAPPLDRSRLRFSASRSQGLGLYAVTRGRRIGVDVERVRPLPDLDAIAECVFSDDERRRLRRLPPAERLEGFFNCWTRKEAYLKAIGTGLAGSPARFTVSLAPGTPVRLEYAEGDPDAPARWTLEVPKVGLGWVGAIAVETGTA